MYFNLDRIEKFINKHTMYISNLKNSDKILAMTKNSFSSKTYRIINNPSNIVAAFSPVEMNEPRAAAELSKSGKESESFNPWNPYVKSKM